MFGEVREEGESEWAAMARVSELLGVGTPETVRKWVRQSEIDAGSRAGVSTAESAQVKRLKGENAELKRANAILKAASVSVRRRASVFSFVNVIEVRARFLSRSSPDRSSARSRLV